MNIPEKDKIVTIKIVTGKEVVGKVKSSDDSSVVLDRPVVIMMSPQGLALGAFVPTMDHKDGVTINKSQIVVIGPSLDKVATEYTSAVSPIKTPPKSSLIV